MSSPTLLNFSGLFYSLFKDKKKKKDIKNKFFLKLKKKQWVRNDHMRCIVCQSLLQTLNRRTGSSLKWSKDNFTLDKGERHCWDVLFSFMLLVLWNCFKSFDIFLKWNPISQLSKSFLMLFTASNYTESAKSRSCKKVTVARTLVSTSLTAVIRLRKKITIGLLTTSLQALW